MAALVVGLEQFTSNYTLATYCDHYACANIAGYDVAEPTTLLTDLALFLELTLLAMAFIRKGCCSAGTYGAAKILSFSFLLLGVSFLFGGLEHGLALQMKCAGRDKCLESSWLWIVSLLAQAPALSSAVVALATLVFKREHACWLRTAWAYCVGNTVLYTTLVVLGLVRGIAFVLGFVNVIIFVVPSAVAILVLLSLPVCCCAYGRLASGESSVPTSPRLRPMPPGSLTALLGWVVCILSLAWQATGIGIHEHFNHNDIFHVVFMLGVAVFAIGVDAFARAKLVAQMRARIANLSRKADSDRLYNV